MADEYIPPFGITEKMTYLIIEIGEFVGRISADSSLSSNPKLHRENRIKTIHSSLAIESNTLSIDQVTDIIDGRRVLAPPQDIKEVQNAYEAYALLSEYDPYSVEDLLKAHKFMMNGFVKDAGAFRSKNAGIYAGTKLIHAGTPSNYVPELVNQLFVWLRESEIHPLIKSCVFHYEFEFIHPFSDGNGRTGRLWHTLILKKWKSFFEWLPVETLINKRQDEYYKAINDSNSNGCSDVFIEFMLELIRDSLKDISGNRYDNVGINVGTNVGTNTEKAILSEIEADSRVTAAALSEKLGISSRQVERILADLKKKGIIIRKGPNKGGQWEYKK